MTVDGDYGCKKNSLTSDVTWSDSRRSCCYTHAVINFVQNLLTKLMSNAAKGSK